jgi:hypothetical protein
MNRAGAYDSRNNQFFVAYGDIWGSPVAATWRYQFASNAWQNMNPAIRPSARTSSAMAYDSARHIIVLYGGTNGGSETWWYHPDSNTWMQKFPTGDSPGTQSEHAMVYMSRSGKMLLKGRSPVGTWIYDAGQNTWTEVVNANTPSGRFWTLSYDSKNDVCLWIAGGGSYSGGWGYGARMYAFRYNEGLGKKASGVAEEEPVLAKSLSTVLISQGSLNSDSTGWAFNPHMVSDGNNLYVGWSEFSPPNSAVARTFQVKRWDGQNWAPLGSHVAAGNREEMAPHLAFSESGALHMAFVKHTLWNGDSILVMKWQSNAWMPVGGAPADTCASVANAPRIAVLGETPYLAWVEMDQRGSLYPPRHALFIKHFSGSGWKQDSLTGRDYFNRFLSAGAQVQSVDIAVSPDRRVYVAWDEFITDEQNCTPNWVFVMRQTAGGVWERLGGALNGDSLNRWATCPSISFLGNDPVIAFNERTESGLNQAFVKKWNGASWESLGGSLNVNGDSGHAYHPFLTNDQGILYAAFCEFGKRERVKGHLKRWTGSDWVAAAGPCNVDSVNGSAADLSVAFMNQKAYLAWSEQTFPGFRQVYAAKADSLVLRRRTGRAAGPQPEELSVSPNPFNPSVTLRWAGWERVQVRIYDLSGQCVADLTTRFRNNTAVWHAPARASGVYVVRLESGRNVLQRTMTLLR